MLSLCKPEQLYQVNLLLHLHIGLAYTNPQIFLAQGIGAGLGAGILYVPSISVVSHYFQKRRALAMSIVASGSSLGAVIHPIMLNKTLRSHLGFGNAVRASAGLVSGLLIIACLLMRPRLPPAATHPPFWKSLPRFARDRTYVLATMAYVPWRVRPHAKLKFPPGCAPTPSDCTFLSSICNSTPSSMEYTSPSHSTRSASSPHRVRPR